MALVVQSLPSFLALGFVSSLIFWKHEHSSPASRQKCRLLMNFVYFQPSEWLSVLLLSWQMLKEQKHSCSGKGKDTRGAYEVGVPLGVPATVLKNLLYGKSHKLPQMFTIWGRATPQ